MTPYRFTFDGTPLTAVPGQTLAAALWAAGITSWRTTRHQRAPRGAFCFIGTCHDCLATVNGRPNQRACLLPVRPGDTVTTQEGTGHEPTRQATGRNTIQEGPGHEPAR
ncbi:(2Fe-2S)-binding protein [Streptomyces thermolilacinus]|uniref:(2Fe-2S)-binding protein n=1 Tax=Streptomyces thermolilacinus TaxID=285540 RepID=UPI0003C76760|nr:(2Fe-2S)-binding protein [Streptomyces thermolilacinus]